MTLPDWIFELFLLVVLILTLVHARKLDRALASIRTDRSMLQEVLVQTTTSLDAARFGISNLKSCAEQTEAALAQSRIKATEAGQHLETLLARANEASEHLSRRVRKPFISAASSELSKAEQDLMKALNLG